MAPLQLVSFSALYPCKVCLVSSDRTAVVTGSVSLALMGIIFFFLSEPQSSNRLLAWGKNTPMGRTVEWLWRRFWAWGALSWVVASIFIPIGLGVAAVQGMYQLGRCLVAMGIALLVTKLIDDSIVEGKSRSDITWIAVITCAIGIAMGYGCFWFIDGIEWKNEMVVKMTFKESGLLTERRRHRIQWDMNTYFLYLKKVGFDLPVEIPPFGVMPSPGIIWVGGPAAGPISTHTILIPADVVGVTDDIRLAYSAYTFNRILVWPAEAQPATSSVEKQNDEVAAWIMECYFSASFADHMVCDAGTPGYKWQEAMWEVRDKLGQDYADGLMCYTVNLWETVPPKFQDHFDKFFRYKLVGGESVKGSPDIGTNVDKIFVRHGLDISLN